MTSTRNGCGNYRRTKSPNGQGLTAERQAEASRQIAETNARVRAEKAARMQKAGAEKAEDEKLESEKLESEKSDFEKSVFAQTADGIAQANDDLKVGLLTAHAAAWENFGKRMDAAFDRANQRIEAAYGKGI